MKYTVKQPIPGFEKIEEVEIETNDGITSSLRGCGEECIAMTLINTNIDHKINLPRAITTLLDIDENTSYSIYFNVVLHQDINKSVINFGAPFVFNEDNKTMAQVSIGNDMATLESLFQ